MPVGQHPRGRLIRCALTGDHVSRDRPRRAAETDQCRVGIERAANATQRFKDRLKLCKISVRGEGSDLFRRIQRIEPRSFAGLKPHRAAERMGNDKNIGKDDCGVEVEAADRLKGYFGRVFRRKAQIEKIARFRPQLPIFRQIAAGLPHHPDRRHRLLSAGEYFQERLGHAHSEIPVIDKIIPDTPRKARKNKFVCRSDGHFQ